MSRYARARRPRARIAVLTAALLASAVGLSPVVTAQASPIVGIDQLDITPNWRSVPRQETVLAVGPTGYAHRTEDADEHSGEEPLWTDFASGTSVPLGYGSGNDAFGERGTGGRYVYLQHGIGTHFVRDVRSGEEQPLIIPKDTSYRGILGETLLFQQYEPGSSLATTTGYFLRRVGDAEGATTPVTGWPAGADLHMARLVAGDADTAVIRFGRAASSTYTDLGVVDLRTGQMRVIASSTPSYDVLVGPVAVTPERIAWVDSARTVHIRQRAALDGPETTYPLPQGLATRRIGLVGDWVLAVDDVWGTDAALRRRLVALSPTGEAHPLLAAAEGELHQIGDGSGAAVVGGTSATDWSLLKVVPGKSGGAPVLEKLRRVEPLPATVASLALGAGRLSTLEPDAGKGGFHARTLPVGPLHTGQSGPVWAGAEPERLESTTPLFDSGDGRTVYVARNDAGTLEVVGRRSSGQTSRALTEETVGSLADAFGRWAAFRSGGGQTLVVDLNAAAGASAVVRKQPGTAAALWGDTLFSGTGVNGEVARVDLVTGKDLGKVATGTACPATELQASAGRWLYWACGTSQRGVVDLRTKRNIPLGQGVTSGGLLGDGYYVDRASGHLRLTDFHTGTASTRVLVDATPVSGTRRESWTVDRFGGAVAYEDAGNRVHVVWTGVPTSDLTAASRSTPTTMRSKDGWKASWVLSKPASNWELTIRDFRSWALTRAYKGGETRGRVDVAWDGRTAGGKAVPNGPYSWDLTVRTADGQGQDLVISGVITVSGGQPAWRDMAGTDGLGDLLVMDPAGLVSMYRGDGYGGLTARTAGTGAKFATTSVPVPFGDVDGDGCLDVLVRVGDQLRAYRPGCGKVVSASSPYTPVGSGWGQYDLLTSPGDMNGDGAADLVVRQTSTGDVYFYGGTADHRLKPRVRIGTNWKLYKKITGAGDLNRDGRSDLVGVDAAGVLWRYYGTPTGGVTARVRLGSGWGVYSTLTGVGDISGDGCPDLVARETTGNLFAYDGTCAGAYGSRRLVGGGWNAFRSLH
ncbi:FlgD immunoglobulin-like domain containing protein [Streptomyces sp. SBC-4]|nr:FG-GAP-like repeat-containing protein [Streptomyces sp. SBC-4]MDV5147165.1 FlgD immunoglobulin-like domain containing protein [Streptomyces sp. SBC-4]